MANKVEKLDDTTDAPGASLNTTFNIFRDINVKVTGNFASIRALLPANQRNNASLVSSRVSDYLQMSYDTRTLLTALDPSDPDRLVNPSRFDYFHAREVPADNIGSGGTLVRVYRPINLVGGVATHLVHREDLIVVDWDGIDLISIRVGFVFGFR